MFKIVYILISNGNDAYYNQLLISLRTLRARMKNIPVIVLSDIETKRNIESMDEAEILKLAQVHGVEIKGEYSKKEKSRYIKTSFRNILSGDLLFIDCDTAICEDFSSYYNEDALAMVDDENTCFSQHLDREVIEKENKKLSFVIDGYKNYYNSGVIWVRDLPETRKFFKYWHMYWKKELQYGDCLDQPPLNYVNEKIMPLISKLPVIWNCQVSSSPSGVQYLSDAYIIHYYNFNSGAYMLANREFVLNNMNSTVMQKIIENPRAAFIDSTISPHHNELGAFMYTKTFRLVFYIFKNFKNFFYAINIVASIPFVIKKMKKASD